MSNYGALFLGEGTCVSYGDKVIGTNQCCPPGCSALHRWPLGRQIPQDGDVPGGHRSGGQRRSWVSCAAGRRGSSSSRVTPAPVTSARWQVRRRDCRWARVPRPQCSECTGRTHRPGHRGRERTGSGHRARARTGRGECRSGGAHRREARRNRSVEARRGPGSDCCAGRHPDAGRPRWPRRWPARRSRSWSIMPVSGDRRATGRHHAPTSGTTSSRPMSAARYLMCRAFLPGNDRTGAGDVINLASVSGKRPLDRRTPYISSRWR